MRLGLILALTLLTSVPAQSDSSHRWYGWQTFLIDGAALSAGALIAGVDGTPRPPHRVLGQMADVQFLVGTVGGPAIHFAQGRASAGWMSLGARALLPPAMATLGLVSTCLPSGRFGADCTDTGLRVGFAVGALVSSLVDGLSLARHRGDVSSEGRRWYGWQTLAVDLAGAGVGVYALTRPRPDARSGPALSMGLGLYLVGFLGAPVVHLAHGKLARAAGDLAMRLFLPGAWAVLGMVGHCGAVGGPCVGQGAELGLLGGAIAVAVIDASLLAWEDQTPTPTELSWLPSVRLTDGGATLQVAGTFD